MEHTFFINALISMRAEIVTLCLDQVGSGRLCAEAVEIRYGIEEGGNRQARRRRPDPLSFLKFSLIPVDAG